MADIVDREKTEAERGGGVTKQTRRRVPRSVLLWLIAVLLASVIVLVWLLFQGESVTAPKETNQPAQNQSSSQTPAPQPQTAGTCNSGESQFSDVSFGMKFCYPTSWGATSVSDAKIASTDAGYRQLVSFSAMPYVKVGGVSDDWSTSVGRDGTCFDPSNQVPALSSYNTDWHNQVGSGDTLEFAERSLPSSVGGYAITERVSNILQNGVCASGYKVVNAVHYRVGSAAYYRQFVETAGITTPALHVANPNVLFSEELRTQFDRLMATLEKT